ncbi:septum formation initiator family protein [Soehngenia longivitae]|uniref:Septum formation initiator family protein n=2 Tax=Soehngenia longivitae TaxID=2562294 RepID=A0A4Z0D2W2_9FIRM|nr:septum formation initiator family protein [Soehngenia longivitae]
MGGIIMIAEKIDYELIKEPIEQKNVKIVHKKTAISKTSYILISVCFLISSVFLLQRYSDIQSLRLEINQLQKQKQELSRIKDDLSVELEGLKNNQEIEKQAEDLLGMSYPKEDQVVYIAVEDTNNTIQFSFIDKIKNALSFFSSLY